MVRYGSAPDNLNQSSILVNGSANLNVTGAQFGVNLTGLVPYSLYYYTIEASNTEGTTTTPVMTLYFFPGRFRGGGGGASYLTPPSHTVPFSYFAFLQISVALSQRLIHHHLCQVTTPIADSIHGDMSHITIAGTSNGALAALVVLPLAIIAIVAMVIIPLLIRKKRYASLTT